MAKMVDVDDLSEGLVINQDVINPQGMVLLKKGISLQDKHIKILKRWGISAVSVTEEAEESISDEEAEDVREQKIEAFTNEINERFSDCTTNETMMLIKKAVSEFRIAEIREGT